MKPLGHVLAQTGDHLAALDRAAHHLGASIEHLDDASSQLVATELGEQLLLCRKVQVLVGQHLLPDTLHVVAQAVGRDALVVARLEDVIGTRLVDETLSKLDDFGLELLRLVNLVGKHGKRQVEVRLELSAREVCRLSKLA